MKAAVYLLFLAYLTEADVKKKELSLPALLLLGAAGLGFAVWEAPELHKWLSLLGGISVGVVLLLISICSRGRIGKGDAVLFMTTGIWFGFTNTLLLLWSASCLAGLFGMVLLFFFHKKKSDTLPFMPFVLAAFMLALLYRAIGGML